jgi:hypothetical protein
MSSIMRLTEIAADGVVQAMRLAADELRLSSATPDQFAAAAAFVARARAQTHDRITRDPRRCGVVARRGQAGKTIAEELRRRAFMSSQIPCFGQPPSSRQQ